MHAVDAVTQIRNLVVPAFELTDELRQTVHAIVRQLSALDTRGVQGDPNGSTPSARA
jgi:hypothetical protein